MTRHGPNAKMRLLLSSGAGALIALLPTTAATAQETKAPDQTDIIVTGTRIVREGYSAQTPTTIPNQAEIERSAKPLVADLINELPSFSATSTPATSQPGGSPTAGMNQLNLRGLGVNRTLVLLNGRRVPPSTVYNTVDINALPTQLLTRIDVVTGGASSSYGSDAVAGVINLILDTKFQGVKGLLQSGVSRYGDGANRRIELAAGTAFLGGRGHIALAGSYSKQDAAGPTSSRDWFAGNKFVTDPNNPSRRILKSGVGMSLATDGGLIGTGPLRGTQFLTGGVPAPFNSGTVAGLLSYGGDAEDQARRLQLIPPQEIASGFGRISFDVAPSVTLFGEAYYTRTHA